MSAEPEQFESVFSLVKIYGCGVQRPFSLALLSSRHLFGLAVAQGVSLRVPRHFFHPPTDLDIDVIMPLKFSAK